MTPKLRLLVAEGPSGQTAVVLRGLFPEEQGGLELTEVSGLPTLMASLESSNPEVILLDLALSRPEPLEVVRRLHRAKPAVPLIVIAEATQKQIAVASLKEGAMDYLLKGYIDRLTLDRVLHGALERNTLTGLADFLRDSLTGLYTREGFVMLGQRTMKETKQKSVNLVLLCARLENFQAIEEDFGLKAKERSLQEVAGLLTRSFRRTDLVSRIGESQFAALAVDAAEPSVPVLLQRLRKHLEALNRETSPWGPLELGIAARFWLRNETDTFARFLDEVEAGLRNIDRPAEAELQLRGSLPRR